MAPVWAWVSVPVPLVVVLVLVRPVLQARPMPREAPGLEGCRCRRNREHRISPVDRRSRPAPGTTTTYAKKGGSIGPKHDDEAQDKKLIKKMIGKKASGGGVGPGLVGYKYRTNAPKGGKGKGLSPYSDAHEYHQQGKGYADGGNVHGAGSDAGRMARNNKVPAKTEL